jgi:hypothetical protein
LDQEELDLQLAAMHLDAKCMANRDDVQKYLRHTEASCVQRSPESQSGDELRR